jgi:Ser/Thr protein kinase RdoA (MazF antagonist)
VNDLEAELRPLLPTAAGELQVLARSHNVVLRAGELVVRIQPTVRMDDAAALALVEYLNALPDDMRAPRPIRLATGEWFAKLSGSRRVMLMSWVAGKRAPDARAFIEPARLHSIGALVARMHDRQVGRVVRAIDFDALFACVRSPAFQAELARPQPFNEALDVLMALSRTPGGLIHTDLEPQNWVFENGEPGVIDFDEFRWGPFGLDLMGVLWTHGLWKEYPKARDELLAGYATVRPVPPGEPDHFTALAFIRWFESIFGEQGEEQRQRHRPYIEPMAARVVEWCSP